MSEKKQHEAEVFPTINGSLVDGYRAWCSCGWRINFAPGTQRSYDMAVQRMKEHVQTVAASTPEAAALSRQNALLEALEAVKEERLMGHEHNLCNSLDVDAGDAAYSRAIHDCEVAITELMSAPPSGEQAAVSEPKD